MVVKNLGKLREEWEKGMQIIVEKEIEKIKKIVVLRDKNNRYFIHIYWLDLQGRWQISVDLQDATLSELLEYLIGRGLE